MRMGALLGDAFTEVAARLPMAPPPLPELRSQVVDLGNDDFAEETAVPIGGVTLDRSFTGNTPTQRRIRR